MALESFSPYFPVTSPLSLCLSVILHLIIVADFLKICRATARKLSHAFQLHSVLRLLSCQRTSEEKKEENSILLKGPSGAIIIRVTHSCQILVDRNESPWGNPPDALGTLHAQLTCIQFIENEGDFANA